MYLNVSMVGKNLMSVSLSMVIRTRGYRDREYGGHQERQDYKLFVVLLRDARRQRRMVRWSGFSRTTIHMKLVMIGHVCAPLNIQIMHASSGGRVQEVDITGKYGSTFLVIFG